jgi:hypothetical protein
MGSGCARAGGRKPGRELTVLRLALQVPVGAACRVAEQMTAHEIVPAGHPSSAGPNGPCPKTRHARKPVI